MNPAPGLYKATVRGVPDQIVMLTDSNYSDPWVSLDTQRSGTSARWFTHKEITDARPLIVLDLEDAPHINGQGARLNPVAWLRATASLEGKTPRGGLVRWIADQIEAQTKPPRIPEPGLWGVVEAAVEGGQHRIWVHDDGPVWHSFGGGYASWSDLLDPTLIRPGVKS